LCKQKHQCLYFDSVFVLNGTGAKLSITFDLSWRVMKLLQ